MAKARKRTRIDEAGTPGRSRPSPEELSKQIDNVFEQYSFLRSERGVRQTLRKIEDITTQVATHAPDNAEARVWIERVRLQVRSVRSLMQPSASFLLLYEMLMLGMMFEQMRIAAMSGPLKGRRHSEGLFWRERLLDGTRQQIAVLKLFCEQNEVEVDDVWRAARGNPRVRCNTPEDRAGLRQVVSRANRLLHNHLPPISAQLLVRKNIVLLEVSEDL